MLWATDAASCGLVVALLDCTLPLIATRLEANLGLTQGPALYCQIWAVPTLLADRRRERHLQPDWQGRGLRAAWCGAGFCPADVALWCGTPLA